MKLPLSRHKQAVGRIGEDLACSFLKHLGYRIISRNFRGRPGELDIVCMKDGVVVFVEVKTRTGNQFGLPEEAVTPRKLREIIETAQYFLLTHPGLPEAQRIDVVAIEMNEGRSGKPAISHIQSVTS